MHSQSILALSPPLHINVDNMMQNTVQEFGGFFFFFINIGMREGVK